MDPAFSRLRTQVRGTVVLPGDEGYDSQRRKAVSPKLAEGLAGCLCARRVVGKREGGITPDDLRHIAATDMRRAGIPEGILIRKASS